MRKPASRRTPARSTRLVEVIAPPYYGFRIVPFLKQFQEWLSRLTAARPPAGVMIAPAVRAGRSRSVRIPADLGVWTRNRPAATTARGRVPRRRARSLLTLACAGTSRLAVACAISGCAPRARPARAKRARRHSPARAVHTSDVGIHKIRHVVMIIQENRSFDSYFGTYPGADGLPYSDGRFTVCLPDPATGGCDRPFHDPSLVNGGGPHSEAAVQADIDGGAMDGFVQGVRDPGRPRLRGLRRSLQLARSVGRDGLPRRARDPELLGVRRELRARRPHVPVERVVEPAGSPVRGVGVVGALLACPATQRAASTTTSSGATRPRTSSASG